MEIDEAAASTYKRNFGAPVYAGPIEDLEQFEPAELMKMWLTPGMEGFSQFQKAMWNAATGSGGGTGSKDD